MKSRTSALYLVSLATFLRSFAQVIYSPSLVTIRDHFQTTTAMVGLTLSVYGLVLAFSQFFVGPVIDRMNGKRILIIGLALFSLVSLGGYFAPTVTLLLAVRALQAVGIAAAASVGIAFIADLFPHNQRGKAMGVFEIFNAAGAAAGPTAGAAIALWLTWQADFLILGVVGLLVTLFAIRLLPEQQAHAQRISPQDMALIFRTSSTGGAILLGGLYFYGLYTLHTLLPILMVDRIQLDVGRTGVMLSLVPIGVILGSLIGGRASDRSGSRRALLISAAGTTLPLSALAAISHTATPATPLPYVGLAIIGYGFTAGIGMPASIKVMVEHFPYMRATAGSLQYFARFIGATIAPVLTGYLADHVGLSAGFGSAAAGLALGAIVAYFSIIDNYPGQIVTNDLEGTEG